MITFIIGGARSGKSSFAMSEALKTKGKKAYVATAQALDEEMKKRIEKHKRERTAEWHAIEEPLQIAGIIKDISGKYDVILLDCLTLWLSNLMMNNKGIEKEIKLLCSALHAAPCTLFVVSNEVGMGIVPENEMARRFRDMAGALNQKVAEIADEVYMVVAGIPVKIKQKNSRGHTK